MGWEENEAHGPHSVVRNSTARRSRDNYRVLHTWTWYLVPVHLPLVLGVTSSYDNAPHVPVLWGRKVDWIAVTGGSWRRVKRLDG